MARPALRGLRFASVDSGDQCPARREFDGSSRRDNRIGQCSGIAPRPLPFVLNLEFAKTSQSDILVLSLIHI